MNLKIETIVQIFRKIIKLNAVIILKSTNVYYPKIISKSGLKMDLYPAMLNIKYKRKQLCWYMAILGCCLKSPPDNAGRQEVVNV